ncbi:PhzF family phenazine biosynthesis protein [Vibrio sp. DW001]|uniref:PhzF family phenazine biosynthesis protein n=1 Tax=Vibrio sp. DW001 TaxID=2912315 RepID=UPI0023AF5663|nr:PhzF family phenazine biosynthesis protein [Vibrio sp. DW001]WED29439.1 PhzF family phenazine biosynthesis protein [Vibrio sp. DW001]
MDIDIYQVDSFTLEPFKGNPAGVCIMERGLDENMMFAIAAEMAVSETAFLSLEDMRLRWFTPKVEVDLCGHGTLAVAHILKENGLVVAGEELSFNTLSGVLLVTVEEHYIELDFPAPIIAVDTALSSDMLNSIGIHSDQIVSSGIFDSKILIEMDSEADLLSLNPNFDSLKRLPGRGVVVTVKSASNSIDFKSRYFAPWVGINEDPVTGSAHCALAVHWGKRLDKSRLRGYQASDRGGIVEVELLPNERVKLIGNAVTVIKGTMRV